MMNAHLIERFNVLLCTAQCKPKDVMVVVELSATDRSSAYFTTLFMPKLKNKLKPTKECLSVGFIFVWKIAESVINLKCDHVRCYRQGQRKAEGIIRRSVRSQGPYDSNEVVKGINMAVKELLPDGVDPKNQREKVCFRSDVNILTCTFASSSVYASSL